MQIRGLLKSGEHRNRGGPVNKPAERTTTKVAGSLIHGGWLEEEKRRNPNLKKKHITSIKKESFDNGVPQVSSIELLLLHFGDSPKPVSWLLLSDI